MHIVKHRKGTVEAVVGAKDSYFLTGCGGHRANLFLRALTRFDIDAQRVE